MNDLISRQAAIDAMREETCGCSWDAKDILKHLPPVSTENPNSCSDAVSRQIVQEKMIKYGFLAPDMTVTEFVEDLPSVTPQPKTGRWIYIKVVSTGEIIRSECSVCSEVEDGCAKRMKFCPNCGAKMEVE